MPRDASFSRRKMKDCPVWPEAYRVSCISFYEKYICDSFQVHRNAIIITVFLLIMNQTEVTLDHNQRKMVTTIMLLAI